MHDLLQNHVSDHLPRNVTAVTRVFGPSTAAALSHVGEHGRVNSSHHAHVTCHKYIDQRVCSYHSYMPRAQHVAAHVTHLSI